MIYSNLAGTTNKSFKIDSGGTSNQVYGQILSNNAYDFYWGAINPVTNQASSNAHLLPNGADLNYTLTPGQYMRAYSTIGLVNSPTIYEFTMIVEPSSGNDLKWLVQKIIDTNGDQFVRYKKGDSPFSVWRRRAWADEVPVTATGNWTPTVPSGFTIASIMNNVYTRMGLYCYLKAYFQVKNISGNHLNIGGLPFNIRSSQMTGSIVVADEFQKSFNYQAGETIISFIPRSEVPAPPTANFFNIAVEVFTNDTSYTLSVGEFGNMMINNVNIHIELDLMYVVA